MHKAIGTALLAYGMSGKVFHAPFLQIHPGFNLKGAWEHNSKKLQRDYAELRSYDTLEEVLDDPAIELVVVNTPNYLHTEHTRKALKAAKHVLVEKPFVPQAGEAEELFELARSVNKKIFVYHNRRYASDFLATRQVIESGRLGHIIEMHLRFDRYRAIIGPKLFKETPLPGSGIVYDLGSHLLDQVISLFGEPDSFAKNTGAYRDHSMVDDFGHIHLIYPDGKNIFITVSMLVADPLPGIVIHGTKGSFVKSFCDTQEEQLISGISPDAAGFGHEKLNQEGRLTVVDSHGSSFTETIPSLTGRYMDIFDAIFQSVRTGSAFPVTESQILTQLRILESVGS